MGDLLRMFASRFGSGPTILVRAPGRVNLVGEHTDYNDGLVLPVAIDREVRIAARPNGTDLFRLYATTYDAWAEFPAGSPDRILLEGWARYPQGVAVRMADHGVRLVAADAVIAGDLPIGSGLSSSAALEVASALAFEAAAGVQLAPRARARLCWEAEVQWVGVPCGIMDQFAATLCRRGHALFLDCRSQETHHIPLPQDVVLAVCDTDVRRAVGDSAYAARRQECAAAIHWLQARRDDVPSLRDLSVDDLPEVEAMPDPLRRRVRHVVTENARVIESARALEGGDLRGLRDIFLASHRRLREDYEVSCPELAAMVEAALEAPGCLAARMTGAGFGGAVVALVRRGVEEPFRTAVAEGYRRRMNRPGVFFTSEAAAGAQ